jgi:hypothetical protein
MVEKIVYKELLLGILLRGSFEKRGIEFFTDDQSSQQLGYMKREKNYDIIPHRHNLVSRDVRNTQEVLFIKSGKVRVDFYDNSEVYVFSKILNPLDTILLCDGGHGFHFLEESEIIEVKQGPYLEERDKVRFNPTLTEIIVHDDI